MAKWPFIPWRQSTASKFRPDSLNYGCLSVSKSGEVAAGDSNNKAVPVLPTGSVIPFAGKTAPTGWRMCQGQAVSRTTYAQLFSVIGTTFGSGDGSTTFNLPDLRGRVAVGVDSDANLGKVEGSDSVIIKKANLPPSALTFKAGAYKEASSSLGIVPQTDSLGSRSDIGSSGWAGTALSTIQRSLNLNQIIKI